MMIIWTVLQVERCRGAGFPDELFLQAHLLLQYHPWQSLPRRSLVPGHVPARRRHPGAPVNVHAQQTPAER